MKANILLVDDEKSFVEVLAERLESRGYATACAFDGEEAVRWLSENSCDVVLLDLGLPGRSGLELLPEIKHADPYIQVLILTAAADLKTAVAGMKLGALDYLTKPVAFDSLIEGLKNAQAQKIKQEERGRMIETSKMAALGVLAEGVAHEIMNPINIMVNEAGWIRDLLSELDGLGLESRQECLNSILRIESQGNRCKTIISRLLAFGGKADPRPKAMRLNELVSGLVDDFDGRAKQQKVAIRTELADDLPVLSVPPAELEIVIRNIIQNALDATEQQGGAVGIRTFLTDDLVNIEISDTGKGIPKSDLPRIFEPFFSTKPVGKGTGLGLSICYSIVRNLGGDITVDSKEGAGTTMTVRVPVREQRASDKVSH